MYKGYVNSTRDYRSLREVEEGRWYLFVCLAQYVHSEKGVDNRPIVDRALGVRRQWAILVNVEMSD